MLGQKPQNEGPLCGRPASITWTMLEAGDYRLRFREDGFQPFLASSWATSRLGAAKLGFTARPLRGRLNPPFYQDRIRSNRSRFITLSHAATKSRTNFSRASSHA